VFLIDSASCPQGVKHIRTAQHQLNQKSLQLGTCGLTSEPFLANGGPKLEHSVPTAGFVLVSTTCRLSRTEKKPEAT
jgi:hypothetical protein